LVTTPRSGRVVVVVGVVVVDVDVVDGVASVVVGVDELAGQPSVIDPIVMPMRVLQPTVTLAALLLLPPPPVGSTFAFTELPVWVTVATGATSTTVLDCCWVPDPPDPPEDPVPDPPEDPLPKPPEEPLPEDPDGPGPVDGPVEAAGLEGAPPTLPAGLTLVPPAPLTPGLAVWFVPDAAAPPLLPPERKASPSLAE